jgi:hypothetical protein
MKNKALICNKTNVSTYTAYIHSIVSLVFIKYHLRHTPNINQIFGAKTLMTIYFVTKSNVCPIVRHVSHNTCVQQSQKPSKSPNRTLYVFNYPTWDKHIGRTCGRMKKKLRWWRGHANQIRQWQWPRWEAIPLANLRWSRKWAKMVGWWWLRVVSLDASG